MYYEGSLSADLGSSVWPVLHIPHPDVSDVGGVAAAKIPNWCLDYDLIGYSWNHNLYSDYESLSALSSESC